MRTQNITRPSTGYDCATDTPQSREFFAMQLCQLEELYTQYGNFSEVWFDGGKYHCNSFRPDLSTDDPDVPGVGTCLPSYEKAIANLTQFYQVLSVWLVSLEYPAITPFCPSREIVRWRSKVPRPMSIASAGWARSTGWRRRTRGPRRPARRTTGRGSATGSFGRRRKLIPASAPPPAARRAGLRRTLVGHALSQTAIASAVVLAPACYEFQVASFFQFITRASAASLPAVRLQAPPGAGPGIRTRPTRSSQRRVFKTAI
jgi:hypothetical protein